MPNVRIRIQFRIIVRSSTPGCAVLSSAAANIELERRPLPEVLYLSLRQKILSGAFPPGSGLRQELLARQFGVSRVPIREAMSRLQAEGLITLRPRRGFAVTSLDIAEIIEIFELRMVLEQHALETATRLRTEADVRQAEALLVRMEALDPAVGDYLAVWLDLNRAFHNCLIDSARRSRLSAMTSNLRDAIEPYIRIESYITGEVDDATQEHREMFDAFKNRAASRAGEVSRDHCLGSMNRLVDNLRNRMAGAVLGLSRKGRRTHLIA